MRIRIALLMVFFFIPAGAAAQATPTDSIIEQLQRRIDSLARVVMELERAGARAEEPADELAALRAAALAARAEVPEAETSQTSRTRSLQRLNPEISASGDLVGNIIAPAGEDIEFAAVPREFEFSFQSALDSYTNTKIFLTQHQDFEIAGLAHEEEVAEEAHGLEIEEAYIYWVGLPGGVGLKLGKIRQDIGLYNRWHTHALNEIERPLAIQSLLGEDGLVQTGASVSLPSFVLGPATQTVTLEVAQGSNLELFQDSHGMSYLGRFQSFIDLGSSAIQLGITGTTGQNHDALLNSNLLGLDFSYRWTPGASRYRDFSLKGEWYISEQTQSGIDFRAQGGYGQANLKLNQRLVLGARLDYFEGYEGEAPVYQLVPTISWWQSEWVRLRLQYNYLTSNDVGGNHTLLLQTVWAMGPHKHETY